MSSTIVDCGYAVSMSYFPTDPVCARLAICLMDEDWELPDSRIHGMSKKWWVEKAEVLFSTCRCVPEHRRDFRVMVALYPGCDRIDLVFSLKMPDSSFAPMVVSVDSTPDCAPEEAESKLDAMRLKAEETQWERGLCLVVLFGTDKSTPTDHALSSSAAFDVERAGIVTKILTIPARR
eukprot:scaffold1028_cov135-Cylindrotheca_fusiformis.AAC.5